ncbi:MAG: hypothetical protein HWE27_08495 [Gammaproteobacteria bacterium]|nr:hypothetical protein [Gammaproteobacteria bacterium]
MKTFRSLFQSLLLLTTLSLHSFVSGATIDPKRFDELNKDMRIMKKIIETSIADDNRYSNRVEAIYLADQGMVFTIFSSSLIPLPDFNGDWEAWGESIGAHTLSVVRDAIPAVAPVLPPEARAEMEAEIEDSLAELEGEFSGPASDREGLRELREQARQQREEYRDNLRKLREIERESYRAETERKEELDKERSLVEKAIEKYKSQLQQYEKKMAELRETRQKKQLEQQMAMMKQTISALCDYQASLRTLPDDEHVTLIFEKFGDSRKQDKIMVFKKSTLEDCESTTSGINKLISEATQYSQ